MQPAANSIPIRHGGGGTQSQTARRRPHRKVKTGCADCRQRRVKCDEKRPICSACERRHRSCVWPSDAVQNGGRSSTVNSPVSVGGSPGSRTSSTSHPSNQPTSSSSVLHALDAFPRIALTRSEEGLNYDLTDLSLIHHWSFVVSLSICGAPSEVDIWRRIMPEVGFQCPFVAHALLSISALHLAGQTFDAAVRSQHLGRALRHHNEGLHGFRNAVTSITAENCEALFVWTVLNVIYVLGNFVQGSLVFSNPSKDLILGAQWIPMLRGIGVVIAPMYEFLVDGRLRSLLTLANWDDIDPDSYPVDDIETQLLRTRETWHKSPDADIYEETLRSLRCNRRFCSQFKNLNESELAQLGHNQEWNGPLIFINVAPEAFFSLLRQRQPPALIIFAFWGAFMQDMRKLWFIEDLGKRVIEVVEELLGSYWRPYIAWPLNYTSHDGTVK